MTADRSRRKTVIGHRGASAYAPENTLPSYDLALRQGVDAIELDVHATKDGALVCLHDRTLERTTNVRDVFPGRGRELPAGGNVGRHWFVHDFTLPEIGQLDAGAWFGPAFAGSRVPAFEDILDWAGERATLLVELKDPPVYEALGVDLLPLLDAVLRRHGIARSRFAEAPVTVQSFDEAAVRRAGELFEGRVPVVLLIEPEDAPRWSSGERFAAAATYAAGIGPGKAMLDDRPQMVGWAHDAGLRVTPWTFRASSPGRFESVRAEMAYYLAELDVDGVITDNPDQRPHEVDWSPGANPGRLAR
jgi:glycerophosphoryl diester phosphodiesterase